MAASSKIQAIRAGASKEINREGMAQEGASKGVEEAITKAGEAKGLMAAAETNSSKIMQGTTTRSRPLALLTPRAASLKLSMP